MELIGNKSIISQINIAIRSANKENRPIPHMLLSGAAGCGKTSTAKYIADITGTNFKNVACDSLKARADILPIVKDLDHTGYNEYGRKVGRIKPTIVFIDEIHGLSSAAQEYLGILMEEWYIAITENEVEMDEFSELDYKSNDTKVESKVRWSPEFTLIGATTNDGKLTRPFQDRFKLRFVFSPYSKEESTEIAITHAKRLKINLELAAAIEIAQRGRGVPRIIVSLLERCRDVAVALSKDVVTKEIAIVTFFNSAIDETGLTRTDINLLKTLNSIAEPVGLENLAMQLNESPKVLSETTEPYLIQRGLILRSPKGRMITNAGKKYLWEKGHLKPTSKRKIDIPKSYNRGL